jgi:hypothetical protein
MKLLQIQFTLLTVMLFTNQIPLCAMQEACYQNLCDSLKNGLAQVMFQWYKQQASSNITTIKNQLDKQEFETVQSLLNNHQEALYENYDVKVVNIITALSVLEIYDRDSLEMLEARLAFFPALQAFIEQKYINSNVVQCYEYLNDKYNQGTLHMLHDKEIPDLFQYAYEQSWQQYVQKRPVCDKSNHCEKIQMHEILVSFIKNLVHESDLESSKQSLLSINYSIDPDNQASELFIMLLYNRELMYEYCASKTQKKVCEKKAKNKNQEKSFLEMNIYADGSHQKECLFFQ